MLQPHQPYRMSLQWTRTDSTVTDIPRRLIYPSEQPMEQERPSYFSWCLLSLEEKVISLQPSLSTARKPMRNSSYIKQISTELEGCFVFTLSKYKATWNFLCRDLFMIHPQSLSGTWWDWLVALASVWFGVLLYLSACKRIGTVWSTCLMLTPEKRKLELIELGSGGHT